MPEQKHIRAEPNIAPGERLLTVAEVADRLGLEPVTVRRIIGRGELRGSKISRRGGWRIRESDLQVYLASRANVSLPRQDGQP